MSTSNRMTRRSLGSILIDEGIIAKEDLDQAVQIQQKTGESLAAILIDMQCVTGQEISKILCSHFQLPYISLRNYDVDPKLVKLFTPDFLHQHKLIPFDSIGQMLLCAVTEIPDEKILTDIPRITKRKVALYAGLLEEIDRFLEASCPLPENSELRKRRSRNLSAQHARAGADHKLETIFEETSSESLLDQLDSTWESIFDAVEQGGDEDLDE